MTPLFLTLALLPSTAPVVDLSSLTVAEAFALDGRPGRYRVVLDSEGDDGFYDCQGSEGDGEGVSRVVRFAAGQVAEDNETTLDVVGVLRVVIHTGKIADDGTVFPGFLAIRLEGARRAGR